MQGHNNMELKNLHLPPSKYLAKQLVASRNASYNKDSDWTHFKQRSNVIPPNPEAKHVLL